MQYAMQFSRRGLLAAAAALAAGTSRAEAPCAAELQVDIDSHAAPDLAAWAARLPALCKDWWPKITDALATPGDLVPTRVQIDLVHIKPNRVAALTQAGKIYVDIDHVRTNPDTGFIAHELVHLAQHYPHPTTQWLSEGIADYLRYYILLPADPQRAYGPGMTYRLGYQPAAAMLDWTVRRYGPGVLRDVNAALREGHDGDAALTAATGQTPASLWALFTADRPRKVVPG